MTNPTTPAVFATTHDVVRYSDGQVIGTVDCDQYQFERYTDQSQQPEGLIVLRVLPGRLRLNEAFHGLDLSTTVYLD